MEISYDEIKRLEKLSALNSSEEKLKSLMKDFNEIATFVEQVKNAKIDDFEMKYYNILNINELRPDVIKPSMSQEEILNNAPEKGEGCFIVPKVVD